MKVWQPFKDQFKAKLDSRQDLPIWFFEDVELPDLDFMDVEWQSNKGRMITTDEIYSKRMTAIDDDNHEKEQFKVLKEIMKDIIRTCRDTTNSEHLDYTWPIDTWQTNELDKGWNFPIDLKLDNKGFTMGRHIDNRNTKWTLILNLRDNADSTTFNLGEQFHGSRYEIDRDYVEYGPKKRGSGVFYFNHEDVLHSIGPVTENGRLTAFWMKMIS